MARPRPHDPLFVLREHTASVLCCNFFHGQHEAPDSPIMNWLLTGDVSGVVKLWDLSLRRSLLTFHPLSESVRPPPLTAAAQVGPSSNPGIIAVGFLWLTGNRQRGPPSAADVVSVVTATTGQTGALAQTENTEGRGPCQRSRFRLARPVHGTASSATDASPVKNERLLFYTQCRNQNLYIWSLQVATNGRCDSSVVYAPQPASLRLEYKMFVPQHGFCPVDVSISRGTVSGYIAVPHDTNGQITVWRISANSPQSGSTGGASTVLSNTHEEPSVHLAAATVSRVDPRDALIAQAQAEEENRKALLCDAPGEATASPVAETSFLSVEHVCTFSGCGSSFKGGVIMQIRFRDDVHLSVAFESGHIALCQFRAWQSDSTVATFKPLLLCATRVFAEPAATCLWTVEASGAGTSYVVATSASGLVQCYTVASSGKSSTLSPALCWEQRFPKGLGSAVLQGRLLVIGAWDRTVRALDVQTGTILSVLTQHSGTVQQVAAVPSRATALQASFGFDNRHPHLYASDAQLMCPPPLPGTAERQPKRLQQAVCAADDDSAAPVVPATYTSNDSPVYLFSSCSDDGTVAVWRVDLHDVLQDACASASLRLQ